MGIQYKMIGVSNSPLDITAIKLEVDEEALPKKKNLLIPLLETLDFNPQTNPDISKWYSQIHNDSEFRKIILEIATSESVIKSAKQKALRLLLKNIQNLILDKIVSKEDQKIIDQLLKYCDQVLVNTSKDKKTPLKATTAEQVIRVEECTCEYQMAINFFYSIQTYSKSDQIIPQKGLKSVLQRMEQEKESNINSIKVFAYIVLMKNFWESKAKRVLREYMEILIHSVQEVVSDHNFMLMEKLVESAYQRLGRESLSDKEFTQFINAIIKRHKGKEQSERNGVLELIWLRSKLHSPLYVRLIKTPLWVSMCLAWKLNKSMKTDHYGLTRFLYQNAWNLREKEPVIDKLRNSFKSQLSVTKAEEILNTGIRNAKTTEQKAALLKQLIVYQDHLGHKDTKKAKEKYGKLNPVITKAIKELKDNLFIILN